jgi:serine-type D-Ala-D-Ala carboxypeptidase/endopeptidase (penicillin-binding protein 4)
MNRPHRTSGSLLAALLLAAAAAVSLAGASGSLWPGLPEGRSAAARSATAARPAVRAAGFAPRRQPPAAAAVAQTGPEAPSRAPVPPALPDRASLDRAVGVEVRAALAVTAALGVHVVDLDSGETVYAYSPDEPRITASNTKLFTTAAALEAFGPGHLFETRFLLRGSLRRGVLRGDLAVVGGGDPNISGRWYDGDSLAVFRGWARELAARGIERVAGDLYLDAGLFAGPTVHPDWPPEQLASWYEAPIGALSFNDNCVLVRVSPTRAGKPARVETIPPVHSLKVESTAKTAGGGGHRLAIGRSGDVLQVSGTVGAAAGPFDTWVTVPDPTAYFGDALLAALGEEGIAFGGRLRPVGRLPGPVWERVAVHRSDMATAVEVTNKRSQNFYAESLLKLLGARRCGEGSWPEGVRAVEEYLTGIGVPRGAFHMVDGSGMSRENRFAPRHVTTLLRHMYLSPVGAEYARSLPYGGEDNGSWKRRLAVPPYRGNVFAKTGTLDGVSALSGYAKAISGRTYAFSILANRVRSGADAKRSEDRIVMAIVDHG